MECYVTVLPGAAGGMLQNINRWRAQVSQPPLSEADLAALERVPMLGTEAPFMVAEGTFSGMRGTESKANYALAGVVTQVGGQSIFVKMTGPAEAVQEQVPAFRRFVASLSMKGGGSAPAAAMAAADPHAGHDHAGHDHAHDHGHDHGAAGTTGAEEDLFDPRNLAWKAPEGWERGLERPMRLVTYSPEGAPEAECYVTALQGMGGGVLPNINRWRNQMALEPITEEGLASLDTVTILGEQVPLLDIEGAFTGMGGPTQEDYGMLGAIREVGSHTLFIKMTGPASAIAEARPAFVTFCESLVYED